MHPRKLMHLRKISTELTILVETLRVTSQNLQSVLLMHIFAAETNTKPKNRLKNAN